MKNNSLVSIAVLVILLIALLYGYKAWTGRAADDPALTTFAQCIASKELTMYGAEWCSHCKAEKARFGSAWQYVPYVECPQNTKLCLDLGVKGYPTWITKDGKKYEGEQGLERLSEISGCPLSR